MYTSKLTKSFFFLILICISFLISISFINTHQNQNNFIDLKFPNSSLTSAYTDANRSTFWRNYTNNGDFATWYYIDVENKLIGWNNLTNTLFADMYDSEYPGSSEVYLINKAIPVNLSTNDIVKYQYKFYYEMRQYYGGSSRNLYIRIYYSDSTYQQIFYKSGYATDVSGNETIEGTLTPNKYISSIVVYMTLNSYGGHGEIKINLYEENYKIYLPLVDNFEIIPEPETNWLRLNEQIEFLCDVYPDDATYTRTLIIKYNETQITANYQLEKETFSFTKCYKYISFNLTGYYYAQIRIKNTNLNYTETQILIFYIADEWEAYPKSTYLTLWSPYDDMSLSGKLQAYLGSDECYKISDFQDNYGYGTNLAWARILLSNNPYISVQNSRLYLTTSGNGAKATLKDTINLTYYDSFKFSLKVTNNSEYPTNSKAFSIVVNPSAWQADYRLNLSAYTSYINKWVTFIIPFKLFTFLWNGEALAEIGFHSPATSGLLDCEIKDIYTCHYNTLYSIINDTGEYFTTNETVTRDDLAPLHFSFENTTSATFQSTINQTYFQNSTFESGFNNSQMQQQNINIINNDTIYLNSFLNTTSYINNTIDYYESIEQNDTSTLAVKNTTEFTTYWESSENVSYANGYARLSPYDYKVVDAWENFLNDVDYGNPNTNWATDESASATVQIFPNYNSYKKVVEFNDSNAGEYCQIVNTPANIVTGTIYFIAQVAQTNARFELYILDSGVAVATVIYFNNNGKIGYSDDTGEHDSTLTYSANTWYTFKITFSCASYTFSAWIYNTTTSNWDAICLTKTFAGGTSPSLIDQLSFATDIVNLANQGKFYVTAFDTSWASGYVENRILNEISEYTDGVYTNTDINIASGHNFVIQNVTCKFQNMTNSNVTINYYDFKTSSWKNLTDYIGTYQSLFKFRAVFNATNHYMTNLTAINLTVYDKNYSLSLVFQFVFNITKTNVTTFSFDAIYSSNKSINLYLFNSSNNLFETIYSLPNNSMSYYLTNSSVIWKFNLSIIGYGNAFYLSISKINITIIYDCFYNSGYYISCEYNFNRTVKFDNFTSSWNNIQNLIFSFSFKNSSGDYSNFQNYSGSLNVVAQYLKFELNFSTTEYNQTSIFYNLSINHTYNQFILSENISKQFDIPQSSLINFTFNTALQNNITIDTLNLYFYNFSLNSFVFIANTTNQTQIFTFSNNSLFFSQNREFLWKINATDLNFLGFSTTQLNYTFNYSRYQFDRQVLVSNVSIESYSNDLYGFTFESDFTNINARTQLFFNNIFVENFTTLDNYTLFKQFSDFGLNKSLISFITFNFTLFNCSAYNENTKLFFHKYYLYENQTSRLYDESNRQYGDVLQFDSELESLLLTDYWGDTIFRELLNRTEVGEFYDIMIPYFTIKFINYSPNDVIFRIEKNNVIRDYRVFASSELEVSLILSDYKLIVVTDVETVTIYEGVLSRTSRGVFSYGTVTPFFDWQSILYEAFANKLAEGETSIFEQIWSNPVVVIASLVSLVISLIYAINDARKSRKWNKWMMNELKESKKLSDKELEEIEMKKKIKNKEKKKIKVPLTVTNYKNQMKKGGK